MIWSFEALTRLARGAVPSALVPPNAWPPAAVLAEVWPARAASVGGVECRLGTTPSSPDLAFCVSVASGGRDALRSHVAHVGTEAQDTNGAAGVRRFLTRWCDPASPLHRHVPLVWLEFDHEPLASGRPVPFVTFRVSDAIAAPEARDVLVALINEGVEALTGCPDQACTNGLMRCLQAFPAAGRLGHVAAMPHRGGDTMRLIVSTPRSEVQPFLTRLGWQGSPSVLGESLAELWPNDGTVALNLDIDGGVAPRVGVELYRPTSPHDDPRWRRLLNMLVAAEACTEEQRAALFEWPSREWNDGPEARPGLLRQLLVKLVFEPRAPVRAKAYLAFTPQWRLFESPAHTHRPIAPDP